MTLAPGISVQLVRASCTQQREEGRDCGHYYDLLFPTRWAATSYKWDYNPFKWPKING